jgi:polyphenol oxidase
MDENIRSRGGIAWISPPDGHLDVSGPTGVRAALSLRSGGISDSPFASLNLGHSAGDAPVSVSENERRYTGALGLPGPIARARLAHGREVRLVNSPGVYAGCDGLLTSNRNLPLWLTVADCYPIYISEPGGWIGLLHCGWKGAAGGCIASIIARMVEVSGCQPSVIRAWIGPGIGQSCYTVGPDIAARFPGVCVRAEGGENRLDLSLAAAILLLDAGLVPGSVTRSALCTACREDLFFSYRRDGARSGRMAAVIWK